MDDYDDELYMLVRYVNGNLGVHPMYHRSVDWLDDVEFIAENITHEEASTLLKLSRPYG